MPYYKIRPLHVGTFPTFEKSMFLFGVDPGKKISVPIVSWLIEGDKGEKVLVDTGPSSSDAPTSSFHTNFESKHEQRIDQVLLSNGVDPEEIEHVIFTHLHFDHCYHPELLKNAKFYVQRSELLYAIHPIEWNHPFYEFNLLPGVTPSWLQVYDRLHPVDGDVELFPGIEMIHLPGHTPGLSGVAVNTTKGIYLIGGDAVPLMENWEGNGRQKHIPSAMVTDMIAYAHSFKKMENITDKVLPGHDFRAFDSKVWG